LRDDMIERRTSFFQENSVLLAHRLNNYKLMPGYRAAWQDRGMLCVAKLAPSLVSERPSPDEFAGLLLREHAALEDDFVEAHIWGPITIRTVAHVRIRTKKRRFLRILEQRLTGFSVTLEIC